jgi:uncharacterized protein YbjT (DUF2867 family)
MTTTKQTILVIGATGRQGGASARHLLAHGWPVRALVRDPAAPAARALAELGADLVAGDLDDGGSVERALEGAYGVHSVQAYLPRDPEREIRQGTTVVDAARATGVRHLVYSSAAGADRHIGIPETDSKWAIEEHLRSSGVPATILRPAYFMDNLDFMRTWILGGTWSMPLPPDASLQLIAADDIGAFVTFAFDRPAELIGRAIEIAGDDLTMVGIAEVLNRVTGHAVRFSEMPIEQARSFDPNLASLCEWLTTHSIGADLPALRALYPKLQTFEVWLTRRGWGQAASETVSSSATPA